MPPVKHDTGILVVLIVFSIGNACSPRLREVVPIIDGLPFDSCVKPCQFETVHIKNISTHNHRLFICCAALLDTIIFSLNIFQLPDG